jgi:hypothetical protein
MTCSKLFSGHIPEISTKIIQNLRNNYGTLYSLTLVNRFWCYLAIPLLWEDPFSILCRRHTPFHFLDIYLLFLSDNDKNELKEIMPYEFNPNLKKPLFNYPSLIKTIIFCRIRLHVENWYEARFRKFLSKTSYFPLTLTNDDSNELTYSGNYEKVKIICTVLFKLFINNASLNNLYININVMSFPYDFLYGIGDMILINPKFLSEIKILSLSFNGCYRYYYKYELLKPFLSSLSSSSSIKHINFCSDYENVKQDFTNIIQSQSKLSSITVTKMTIELDSLKYFSNTLTSINFDSCNFNDAIRFDALTYLIKLESLQFKDCSGLNLKVVQPLLNIITPLKIKTLVIIDEEFRYFTSEMFDPIQLLIIKIGSYIENLVLDIHTTDMTKLE